MCKRYFKRVLITLEVCFLFFFMLLIFGPSEIFFANVTEFDFILIEFAPALALYAIVGTLILSFVLSFLPDKIHRFAVLFCFGITVAGYLQVMFLNKGLDLLGVNPEGYHADTARIVINLIIWILITVGAILLVLLKKELWKKVLMYLSAFLICIQVVALISLYVTADEKAFERAEGKWHLSGEEQYTVSADKNVIVLILDYFSNQYLEPLETAYPGATEFLHDFTFYNNMDCVYFGTFPSLPHILTGQEVDMNLTINDWCKQIWEADGTEAFYSGLRECRFKSNIYTADTNILCGLNDIRIMEGKVSNLVDSAQEVEVNRTLLRKTLFKMSAYRMFPEICKPYFYANIDEYADVVKAKENQINHNNYDFYEALLEKGLSVDDSSNYFIVQHLMGPHLYTTDANGVYKEDSTLEETTKGCMVIVEEYLNQLKNLGVYDDATIIVTADHGGGYDSQVIFYIKQPGEKHNSLQVCKAPVSLHEFLPTIAQAAGLDAKGFGKAIYDFTDEEQRVRTYWLRMMDSAYPTVPCYTGDKDGSSNVYYGYTYTGDINELLRQTEQGPSLIVPMVDSYF